MKKKRITYGVRGMMEYQTEIYIGKTRMKLTFTDGAMSGTGNVPARFTTDNIIMQNAIERSPEFKRGRIEKVCELELNEDLCIERNQRNISEEQTDGEDKEPAEEVSKKSADVKDDIEVKEFSCNDDAKDYLSDMHGYERAKLRNREDIVKAGKSVGVDIRFT